MISTSIILNEMKNDYLENLQLKLQRRVETLSGVDPAYFYVPLRHFWRFLNSVDIFKYLLKELKVNYPQWEAEAARICQGDEPENMPEDETEDAARACFVIEASVENSYTVPRYLISAEVLKAGTVFSPHPGRLVTEKQSAEALDRFRVYFIEPLYLYLREQLEDQRIVLALLMRYKQKCEIFQKETLLSLVGKSGREDEAAMRQKEKKLEIQLYEYLHDQGWSFNLAPKSAGEVDLLTDQLPGPGQLYLEARIYHALTSKQYLAEGINQLYQHLRDNQQPSGYFVIYNLSRKTLSFNLPDSDALTPHLTCGNKTIFLITIDIPETKAATSRSGAAQTIVFSQKDLTSHLEPF